MSNPIKNKCRDGRELAKLLKHHGLPRHAETVRALVASLEQSRRGSQLMAAELAKAKVALREAQQALAANQNNGYTHSTDQSEEVKCHA